MFRRGLPKTVAILTVTTALQGGGGQSPDKDPATDVAENQTIVLEGLTRPSRRVKLALRVPGIISERLVKEGSPAKAGQVIAELDSEPEKAALEISRLKAESDHEIRAAEVNEKLKRYEVMRVRKLGVQSAASENELQEAECGFELAQVQTETARFARKLLAQELRRDEIALAQRRLLAPFDGIIWRTFKEEGEAVDELEPIAELVKLDPLWVEVNVAAEHFGRVTQGQEGTVTVAGRSRSAKVITMDPLVDAGSSTFRIKLEMANSDGVMVGGVPAQVRLKLRESGSPTPNSNRTP